MADKVCPKCGGTVVMIKEDRSAGACHECGYAWLDGYPCICGDRRGQYRSGSGHRSDCPMHSVWYYENIAQVVR